MSRYPYETPQPSQRRASESIDQRALRIAYSEGRTEITQLDRIRAERELQRTDGGN
jgi:hypothetical protein